jgi:pSer/pThr/pTyr-binding forkhead associated (FHA) protein
MDSRPPSDVQATGTLPLSGHDALSVGPVERERPAWLVEARDGLPAPGRYLAYEEPGGRRMVAPLAQEWTRIGRSLAAEVRFDDATVSRRHALVVSQDEGVRVLDDRSLNGVYVNGERVEWSPLADGDEITIGRHAIFFLDTATIGSPAPQAAIAD